MRLLNLALLAAVAALSGCGGGEETGRIEGMVVDAAGRPVADAVITVTHRPAGAMLPDIAPITNSEGRFSLAGLPPGDYTLRTNREGQPGATATATVRKGKATDLKLTLK